MQTLFFSRQDHFLSLETPLLFLSPQTGITQKSTASLSACLMRRPPKLKRGRNPPAPARWRSRRRRLAGGWCVGEAAFPSGVSTIYGRFDDDQGWVSDQYTLLFTMVPSIHDESGRIYWHAFTYKLAKL